MDYSKKLLYLISTSVNRLKYYSIERFNQEGLSFTPSQMAIIFLLREGEGQTMTGLSRALSLDNSTLTRLVDRLEKQSLVERRKSEEDRRIWNIFITGRGLSERKKAAELSNEINELVKEGFTDREIEAFIRVLLSFNKKFTADKED